MPILSPQNNEYKIIDSNSFISDGSGCYMYIYKYVYWYYLFVILLMFLLPYRYSMVYTINYTLYGQTLAVSYVFIGGAGDIYIYVYIYIYIYMGIVCL